MKVYLLSKNQLWLIPAILAVLTSQHVHSQTAKPFPIPIAYELKDQMVIYLKNADIDYDGTESFEIYSVETGGVVISKDELCFSNNCSITASTAENPLFVPGGDLTNSVDFSHLPLIFNRNNLSAGKYRIQVKKDGVTDHFRELTIIDPKPSIDGFKVEYSDRTESRNSLHLDKNLADVIIKLIGADAGGKFESIKIQKFDLEQVSDSTYKFKDFDPSKTSEFRLRDTMGLKIKRKFISNPDNYALKLKTPDPIIVEYTNVIPVDSNKLDLKFDIKNLYYEGYITISAHPGYPDLLLGDITIRHFINGVKHSINFKDQGFVAGKGKFYVQVKNSNQQTSNKITIEVQRKESTVIGKPLLTNKPLVEGFVSPVVFSLLKSEFDALNPETVRLKISNKEVELQNIKDFHKTGFIADVKIPERLKENTFVITQDGKEWTGKFDKVLKFDGNFSVAADTIYPGHDITINSSIADSNLTLDIKDYDRLIYVTDGKFDDGIASIKIFESANNVPFKIKVRYYDFLVYEKVVTIQPFPIPKDIVDVKVGGTPALLNGLNKVDMGENIKVSYSPDDVNKGYELKAQLIKQDNTIIGTPQKFYFEEANDQLSTTFETGVLNRGENYTLQLISATGEISNINLYMKPNWQNYLSFGGGFSAFEIPLNKSDEEIRVLNGVNAGIFFNIHTKKDNRYNVWWGRPGLMLLANKKEVTSGEDVKTKAQIKGAIAFTVKEKVTIGYSFNSKGENGLLVGVVVELADFSIFN